MHTGIEMLDRRIGEIPRKTSILLGTYPAIDPTPFALSILVNAIEEGERVAYVVDNKTPQAVRRLASTLGFDLAFYEKKENLALIDAFSAQMQMPSEEQWVVEKTLEIDAIREVANKTKHELLIFDSISSLLDFKEDTLSDILEWVKKAQQEKVFLGLFSFWGYEEEIIRGVKESFNGIFTIKPVEEVTIIREFLYPEKIEWKKVESFAVPVKILEPGGTRVYFPKILVTGPSQAGKSTLVRAMSTRSVSVDRMGTTVALDHGYLDYRGITADIYGTPGQEPFDPLLEYLGEKAVAVILVLDSTAPDLVRAKQMLAKARASQLPFLVAANKQDKKDALSVEQLTKKLALPPHVPIISTVATKCGGVDELLDKLVDRLISG